MRHAGFSCLGLEVIRVIFTHRPLVKAVYTLPNYLEVRLGNTGAHVAYLVSAMSLSQQFLLAMVGTPPLTPHCRVVATIWPLGVSPPVEGNEMQ